MTTILFQPHSDDAVLFSSFNAIRYNASVITVLTSQVQEERGAGITQETRELEDIRAFKELGIRYSEQWPEPDSMPDWDGVEMMMRALPMPERVLAPAYEEGGHDQHNSVGVLAKRVFGDRVISYLTYRRGFGKSEGEPVDYEPEWVQRKLRSLACYTSQIREQTTRPWFMGDIYEYVAA